MTEKRSGAAVFLMVSAVTVIVGYLADLLLSDLVGSGGETSKKTVTTTVIRSQIMTETSCVPQDDWQPLITQPNP